MLRARLLAILVFSLSQGFWPEGWDALAPVAGRQGVFLQAGTRAE